MSRTKNKKYIVSILLVASFIISSVSCFDFISEQEKKVDAAVATSVPVNAPSQENLQTSVPNLLSSLPCRVL